VRIAVVLNSLSSFKKRFYSSILPVLRDSFHTEVFETTSQHDALLLGQRAVSEKFDIVVAAGGDGTVHQVINGIIEEHRRGLPLPNFAVLPLGTGNDFARTTGSTNDPVSLVDAIRRSNCQTIDIGEVQFTRTDNSGLQRRYFVNVADVGMGPEVVRSVLKRRSYWGAALSYYTSIISIFFSYKARPLSITSTTWARRSTIRTVAIANGKFYGHGLCIAPGASLVDGKFNVFLCTDVSVLDFILQTVPLKKGKIVRHPGVEYLETESLRLESEARMEIEADGEILGLLPATVTLSDIKLKVYRQG
jgi:diacylglycerol kinase (ATP)